MHLYHYLLSILVPAAAAAVPSSSVLTSVPPEAEFLPSDGRHAVAAAPLSPPGLTRARLGPELSPSVGRDSVAAVRRRFNVVQIVWDTVRGDHMSLFGYERDTTPFLDGYSNSGYVFSRYYSDCNWTNPSVATMFTSLTPQTHKMYTAGIRFPSFWTTTAEMLAGDGYRTALLTTNPMLVEKDRNLDQGMDRVVLLGRPESQLTREFFDFVDAGDGEPFFAHVQYFGAHAPYQPSEMFDSLFVDDEFYGELGDVPGMDTSCLGGIRPKIVIDDIMSMDWYEAQYDALIREMDHELSEVFAGLESRGLLDSTLVVLTSDHGELLGGEHGHYFCHVTFFDGMIYVPMVVWLPTVLDNGDVPLEPYWDSRYGSHLDLQPTVMHVLGGPPSSDAQGRSLFGNRRRGYYIGSGPNKRVVQAGLKKLVQRGLDFEPNTKVELYDLKEDPLELRSLAAEDTAFTLNAQEFLLPRIEAADSIWREGSPGVYLVEDFEDSTRADFHFYPGLYAREEFSWDDVPEPGNETNQILRATFLDSLESINRRVNHLVGDPQRSYEAEFRIQLLSGQVSVSIARTFSTDTGYRMVVDSDSLQVYTVFGGEATLHGSSPVGFPADVWREVRFEARDGNVSLHVDDELLFEWFEPQWPWIYGSTELGIALGTDAFFDDFVLSR